MTEAARANLAAIRGLLAPLDDDVRREVLAELGLEAAAEARGFARMLDEARETTEEWRRHNEQRLEEVYAARALVGAQPHETLPLAIARALAPPRLSNFETKVVDGSR